MGIKRKGMTIVSEPIKPSGNGKRWWEERRERETEKGPPFLLYPIGGGEIIGREKVVPRIFSMTINPSKF